MKILCIYNASSTLLGEAKYLYNKYVQSQNCAMCDITHSVAWQKKQWQEVVASSEWTIETVHTNETPADLPAQIVAAFPCVVLAHTSKYDVLLTADELESCGGDVWRFKALLDESMSKYLAR